MCGIAGYSSKLDVSDVNQSLLAARMALAHRGPDDSGVYVDPTYGIGLAHTRLSIQDLSPLGHQPMVSADGRVALVFNGEIYNFRELRAELLEKGCEFRGQSDTEVLLQLFLVSRQQPDEICRMLQRLNGIFAVAIWDAEKEALLLARDAVGVKPLYFGTTGQVFAFASEIKALIPLLTTADGTADELGEIDHAALDRYLTYLWCPGGQTPSNGVTKLLPGEALWVKQGKIHSRYTWYRLPSFRTKNEHIGWPQVMPLESAITGTARRLREAVHRQMVSDVPLGAFLSGGLDSSSVVAFAREQNPDIRCFTIEAMGVADEGMADDLPYAMRVAEHLHVPLEVVQVDPLRMAADLPGMVAQLDEPLADPAPLNVLYISQLARQQGIKVLLSGAGGDDLFTGYRRHRALITERYWNWLPDKLLGWLDAGSQNLSASRPLSRRLRKLFSGAALKGDERLVHYFRWVSRTDLMTLYTPSFRSALSDSRAETPMLEFLAELPAETEPLERMLALEQRFFLADHNLAYTDKMSMAVGVEVRVPFLDLDLVEFAAQIPSRYKQRGSSGKWVLKRAMETYLPRDVIYRPKSGFGAPLRRWLRVELRDWLADTLSPHRLNNRGLFDPVAVNRLIRDNMEGRVDASYTLLSLACIEMWCQHFIDSPSRHPTLVSPSP
jgi:asparagine synthase (glutamine-hydrolysing)